ncbi:hypothetical protein IX51_08945 [uncultured archaeon]|nr:hypothetical protein IX51_08945 [uncultured archaeon]
MRVRDLIIEDIPKADVSTSILDACTIMIERRVTGVAVYQDGQPIGMVTERSLLRRFVPLNKPPDKVSCREVMVPMLKVSSKATVRDAVDLLIKNGRTRLAVYNDGEFKGWVLLSDLVPYAMKRDMIHMFGFHGMEKGHDIMCPSCQSEYLAMSVMEDGVTVRWECPKCGHTE